MKTNDLEQSVWQISQTGPAEGRREFYESVFSLGNGYMGVRGFDEEDERPGAHELCVYLAGIFDYFNPRLTDMVNTPNFWKTRIWINGQRLGTEQVKLEDYQKNLDMANGVIRREGILVCPTGERTRFESIKFLGLDQVHQAVLSIQLTPLNYDGSLEIETGIDTRVSNRLVQDDQMLDDVDIRHFLHETSRTTPAGGAMIINLATRTSAKAICEGFTAEWLDNGQPIRQAAENLPSGSFLGKRLRIDARCNHTYTMNKMISIWTSRDCPAAELADRVSRDLTAAVSAGLTKLLAAQTEAWQKQWRLADIIIDGDPLAQKALRFNIYHLIQTCSAQDSGVSIGARGIMHSRYKGCFFWDTEIFMLPFYLLTQPEAARNLLLYRYHTLDGARHNARAQNVSGARYPWMSALDGIEQCESWDIGLCEIHVIADIAYAVNQYYEVTGDWAFIRDYGLEILIETARYWVSRFSYDRAADRYNLLYVKGPDEYGGVTSNNNFTVMMARHNLRLARTLAEKMAREEPEAYQNLCRRIGFNLAETEIWQSVETKSVTPYLPERSLYLEDDLYLKTEPLDLKAAKDGDVPLYKKICFDRLQRYRVLKQADVILLMLLLPDQFSREEKEAAWNEYEPITSHDSSLSFGTHAEMAAVLEKDQAAIDYFDRSVGIDLYDRLANTGREGLHFASMGSSWQAIVKGFAGCQISGGKLKIKPRLPACWNNLQLRIQFQGYCLLLSIGRQNLKISAESGPQPPLDLEINQNTYRLAPNQTLSVELK